MKISLGNPIDETLARTIAQRLLTYACNGKQGRPEKGDLVYDSITENRDCGSVYSSCGDLGHWLLFRMGVRLGFINRTEHQGWLSGKNVSRLAWTPYSKAPSKGSYFQCGDVIIIWSTPTGTDAHVMCVLKDLSVPGSRRITTANYGQPGGKIFSSSVRSASDGLWLGDKKIQRCVSLVDVLKAAQSCGKLVDVDDVTLAEDGTSIWEPS